MKRNVSAAITLLGAMLALSAQPALAISKETLRMMQQLDELQQMVQNLQKTVDTQTAVLRTLVEQANDNVNSMKATVTELRSSSEKNLASTNARIDSMTTQMQALGESLDEAKARLAKLSDQLAQTQNIIQTLNAPPAAGTTPGTPGTTDATGDAKPAPAIPNADSLFKSGVADFNGGQYALAIQAFQEYLQYYGNTDQAVDAQFYIGESYYSQGNYDQAIVEYNKCLERYPSGDKLPAAQLKKGYAYLALNKKDAGIRELRSLIERYPDSREAELARQRLRKLTASTR